MSVKAEESEEIVRPARPNQQGVVVGNATTLSTRQRADIAASSAKEPVVRTNTRQGLTEPARYNGSLRHRLENAQQQESEARSSSEPSIQDDIQRETERVLRCRRDEAMRLEQAAQRKRQQDTENAQRLQAQRDAAKKMLAVDLTLASANPALIARVKSIVARNFPADKFSPERHWMVLQKLRDAVGIQ